MSCMSVKYCNTACQRNHWSKHKKICKRHAAELRDEALFNDPPAKVAEKVYNIAHGREVIEGIVKEELTKNPGPPGKFYPFMSGKIKPESPLGKLLATKGITPANSNQFEGSADW